MRQLPFTALLLAGLACAGCTNFRHGVIIGSGRIVSKELGFSGFSVIEAGSAFQVEITGGNSYSAVVSADENYFDYIRHTQVGSTLRIYLDTGRAVSLRPGNLKLTVVMPMLEGLKLSGAARGSISGFDSVRDLELGVSGASTLVGTVRATNTNVDLSGASSLTLQGSTKNLTVVATGASRAMLGEFQAEVADARVSGASSVTLKARSGLTYDVSGASRLTYLGHPPTGKALSSGNSTITSR